MLVNKLPINHFIYIISHLDLGWPKRNMWKDHYRNDPEGNAIYAGITSRMDSVY